MHQGRFSYLAIKTWFIQNLNFGLTQFVILATDVIYSLYTSLNKKKLQTQTDLKHFVIFLSGYFKNHTSPGSMFCFMFVMHMVVKRKQKSLSREQ